MNVPQSQTKLQSFSTIAGSRSDKDVVLDVWNEHDSFLYKGSGVDVFLTSFPVLKGDT